MVCFADTEGLDTPHITQVSDATQPAHTHMPGMRWCLCVTCAGAQGGEKGGRLGAEEGKLRMSAMHLSVRLPTLARAHFLPPTLHPISHAFLPPSPGSCVSVCACVPCADLQLDAELAGAKMLPTPESYGLNALCLRLCMCEKSRRRRRRRKDEAKRGGKFGGGGGRFIQS